MSEDILISKAFQAIYRARYQEAANTFEQLSIKQPTNPSWKYFFASTLTTLDRLGEAERIFGELVISDDSQSHAHGLAGSARISRIQLGKTLGQYLQKKELIPLNLLREFRTEFQDIKQGIEQAIDKEKGICLPDFHNEYGTILGLEACFELHNETCQEKPLEGYQKLFEKAIEKYDSALKINPAYIVVIHNKGMLYFDWALQLPEHQRKEKLERAITYFEESLSKNKEDVESLLDKGTVLCYLKRYKEAKEQFLRAASLNINYTQKSVRRMGASVLREIGIDKDMKPLVAPRIVSI